MIINTLSEDEKRKCIEENIFENIFAPASKKNEAKNVTNIKINTNNCCDKERFFNHSLNRAILS